MATAAQHGTGRRRRHTIGAAAVAVGLLLVAGCSSDGGSDDASPKRTTTTEADATSTTTSTTEAEATTSTTEAPAVTTTTAAPTPPGDGPTTYTGAIDGQAGSTVGFVRDGATITGFEARGVEVECQPLDIQGEPKNRTVSVDIAEAPVAADRSVTHTEEKANLSPTLSGAFAADGSFAGGIYLSGEDDGFVCGGDLTFLAAPA